MFPQYYMHSDIYIAGWNPELHYSGSSTFKEFYINMAGLSSKQISSDLFETKKFNNNKNVFKV